MDKRRERNHSFQEDGMGLVAMRAEDPDDPDGQGMVEKRKGTSISAVDMPMTMTATITDDRSKIDMIDNFIVI